MKLEQGRTINTLFGKTISVIKPIGVVGQNDIYLVEYNGEKKVLKIYREYILNDGNTFYNHMKHQVVCGSPGNEFLWPLDITEVVEDNFGVVYDLVPEGYHLFSDYLQNKVSFASYKTIIDAALKLVYTFSLLHIQGLCFVDVNEECFLINHNNGDIIVSDTYSIVTDGTNLRVYNKPRYTAPEIITEKYTPNRISDRYSLSVLIYMLFCKNHPLEGKRSLVPCLTAELQEKLYGTEPLFMMDPDNTDNGPHPLLHENSIVVWKCLPVYIKEIFLKAFSKESFTKPNSRPDEMDWLDVLMRFRSNIVLCTCGNEVIIDEGDTFECDSCGKMISITNRLELSIPNRLNVNSYYTKNGIRYTVPAVKGCRLYKSQLGLCNYIGALSPVALIVGNNTNPNALGIKYLMQEDIDALTPSGKKRIVKNKEIIPIKSGIVIRIKDSTIRII